MIKHEETMTMGMPTARRQASRVTTTPMMPMAICTGDRRMVLAMMESRFRTK